MSAALKAELHRLPVRRCPAPREQPEKASRVEAERSREVQRSGEHRIALRPADELRGVAPLLPGASVYRGEGSPGSIAEAAEAFAESRSDTHGCRPWHTAPNGVKGDVAEGLSPAGVLRQDPRVASATADRIRTYCRERGVSLRAMSAAAFDNPTQLGMVLKRLDAGSSVAIDVLERVAAAMGWPLSQLRGEGTAAPLADLPGWAEAADEARTRYRVVNA